MGDKIRRRSSRRAVFAALAALELDPVAAAKGAGLRYVSDERPGIARQRAGRGFRYFGPDGEPVRDERTRARITALAIPPAWTDVWICPDPRGHVQATGRDAKGRKQYRYHPRWREVRDETKYTRLIAFGQSLPRLREQLAADLARPGVTREKVLAAVVRLLETTLIRVGNEEYARANDSFGLTTLRDEHVAVDGSRLSFRFRGKSGIEHEVDLRDRRLAAIVKRCQDLPGQDLFQYEAEDGELHRVTSEDVNAYLQEVLGEEFTAKDFRTWAGTVLAAQALAEFGEFDSEAQAKQHVVAAIEAVAGRLGNTRAVCRKCYVHPAVVDAYLDGSLRETLQRRIEAELEEELHRLPPEEAAVLVLLRSRLEASGAGREE
jgi:DNA topoisomerase-1